ncbi:MAG: hypothetical protein ABIR37_03135 [Candidatus Saccharimonadales bacterium]
MAKTKNTIELNGKRYDALTGTLLSHGTEPSEAVAVTIKHHVKKPGTAAHHTASSASVPAGAKKAVAAPRSTGQVMDIRRAPAGHIKHHRPEPSKTLMRKVVKKPEPSLKRSMKTQPRTDILAKTPAHLLVPKASLHHIDVTRLKRAEHVAKNNLVSRFGQVSTPVANHAGHAAHQMKHDVNAVIAGVSSEISSIQPVYAATANAIARPSMDIFEQALARANSHKETYIDPKKAHRAAKRTQRHLTKRIARSGSIALAVVLVAGFIAYQNTANLTMRVASSKAGFQANMPGFKPSGFAAAKFTYGKGFVAVNFHSNSDSRAFDLTQKVSNWDSEALLNEFVSDASGKSYQTLEASGRTIYTYGNNNATWVDHGVWFNVQSNGSLSTTQLVSLATSM